MRFFLLLRSLAGRRNPVRGRHRNRRRRPLRRGKGALDPCHRHRGRLPLCHAGRGKCQAQRFRPQVIRVIHGDVKDALRRDLSHMPAHGSFSHAFANPPYFEQRQVDSLANPSEGARALLRPGGSRSLGQGAPHHGDAARHRHLRSSRRDARQAPDRHGTALRRHSRGAALRPRRAPPPRASSCRASRARRARCSFSPASSFTGRTRNSPPNFSGLRPIGGRARERRVPRAEQLVRYPAHVLIGGPCAQHTQVGVDLRAVGVDHHRPSALGLVLESKLDGEIALAARGGPCDERQRRLADPGSGDVAVLIARLIADSASLASNLDRAREALDRTEVGRWRWRKRSARAAMRFELLLPEGDPAGVRAILDALPELRPARVIAADRSPRKCSSRTWIRP